MAGEPCHLPSVLHSNGIVEPILLPNGEVVKNIEEFEKQTNAK